MDVQNKPVNGLEFVAQFVKPSSTKHVTAILSREDHEILRRYAFDRHLSLSSAVTELIHEYAAKKQEETG